MQLIQAPTHVCNPLCREDRRTTLVYADGPFANDVLMHWDDMCEQLGELRPAVGIQEAEGDGWLITWLDVC